MPKTKTYTIMIKKDVLKIIIFIEQSRSRIMIKLVHRKEEVENKQTHRMKYNYLNSQT